MKTQKAPLKKFVTFEGVSEVELGTGPIIQSHTSMLSSQTYAQHSEGQFIKEGPYVVPEIIVTRQVIFFSKLIFPYLIQIVA